MFEWSCDNDEVPLNLKTMYSRTLYVDPNSLPGRLNALILCYYCTEKYSQCLSGSDNNWAADIKFKHGFSF